AGAFAPLDVVPGGERIRSQLQGGVEQVGELDLLVAGDAGDGRLARRVAVGEGLDHAGPEARLVVQNVVGNAEPVGHPAGVVDVLAGAAGPAPSGRRAVVVEL